MISSARTGLSGAEGEREGERLAGAPRSRDFGSRDGRKRFGGHRESRAECDPAAKSLSKGAKECNLARTGDVLHWLFARFDRSLFAHAVRPLGRKVEICSQQVSTRTASWRAN